MAMALLAQAVDFSAGRIEGGEQGGGAVALVIVRHGLAAALLQRQTRLSAVERLNLALLIDRKHQRMLGGIEIQTNNGFQLLGKMGIVADLKGVDAMRLQPVRSPDTAHAGLGDTHLPGHPAARPVGRSSGLRLRCSGNYLSDDARRNLRRPSWPGSVLHQPLDTQFDKPAAPKRYHARRN